MEATLDQLDTFVRTVSECLPGDDWLFRGSVDWQEPLVPPIDREPFRGSLGRDLEQRMVERFRREVSLAVDPMPRDEIEWLCLAGHYGVPTRLLEWSRNPLAALYHAVEGRAGDREPGQGGVVAFRSADFEFYEPLSEAERADPFGIEGEPRLVELPRAVHPVLGQNASFTLHPEITPTVRPEAFDGELHTFLFPNRARRLLRAELRLFGVHAAALFPHPGALAHSIVDETLEGLTPLERDTDAEPTDSTSTLH